MKKNLIAKFFFFFFLQIWFEQQLNACNLFVQTLWGSRSWIMYCCLCQVGSKSLDRFFKELHFAVLVKHCFYLCFVRLMNDFLSVLYIFALKKTRKARKLHIHKTRCCLFWPENRCCKLHSRATNLVFLQVFPYFEGEKMRLKRKK